MSDTEKILVLSVGGTEEPLIFAIDEINPDLVYFLYTPGSKATCESVIEKTCKKFHYKFINKDSDELILDFYSRDYDFVEEKQDIEIKKKYIDYEPVLSDRYMINNHESLDESFEVSKRMLKDIGDRVEKSNKFEVYIDFTGGTKPMVSGLVLAVIEGEFKEFELTYVGGKDKGNAGRDKGGVGVVKKGYELQKKQINPYEKHAIPEFKRGINFFNEYQFQAAKENFELAKKDLKDGFDKELAKIYYDLVVVYDKWDKFDEEKATSSQDAYEKLGGILNKIKNNDKLYSALNGTDLFAQLNSNYEFLSLKIRGISADNQSDEKKDLSDRIFYYLPDLFENASRRIDEAKYDDAMARLYRITELIAQIKLNELELIDKKNLENSKAFSISIDSVKSKAPEEKKQEIYDFISDKQKYSEDKNKYVLEIANKQSYELLKLFGFDRVAEQEKVYTRVQNRNNSILAHGLTPIRRKSVNKTFKEVMEFAELFYSKFSDDMIDTEDAGEDITSLQYYRNLARFPKLEMVPYHED